MIKNQRMIKLFLSLLVCTLFIFSTSYFGSKVIGKPKQAVPRQAASKTVTAQPTTQHVQTDQEAVRDQATVELKEIPEDLQAAISNHPKIDIPSEASFSLLEIVTKQGFPTLSSDSLSILATGIYQAILPTNFVIEERNIGNVLPDYAQLGDEAKVDFTQKMDLAFSNPNNGKYTLDLQLNGNSLKVTLKGEKFPYDYKITKKNKQDISPKTVVQYSPMLTSGQTTLKNPGRNGQTIEVYRLTYKGDMITNTELISEDYYPPEYRVEIHALNGSATQPGTATGSTDVTNQQNTDSSQTGQSTSGETGSASSDASSTDSTGSTGTTASSDSSLWGKPNEVTK